MYISVYTRVQMPMYYVPVNSYEKVNILMLVQLMFPTTLGSCLLAPGLHISMGQLKAPCSVSREEPTKD